MANDNHLVELPGHGRFWLLLDDDGSGPLAPLDHCDEKGDVTLGAALLCESYAHMFSDGTIMRHKRPIAHRRDLIVLPQSVDAVLRRQER